MRKSRPGGDWLAHLRLLAVLLPMAVAVGSLSAFFLWSLDAVTAIRFDHPWLLYLLPVAGLVVGWLYLWIGRSAEGGTNLIMEQVHLPGGGVPRRMAPLILFGTLVTHLFGGSAGREGTAVQMGGSIASAFCRLFKLEAFAVRLMLMAGIAAGFGAVFGTPLAGTFFAFEVLLLGRVEALALLPCLIAALVGDWACRAWGIEHSLYRIAFLEGRSAWDVLGHLELALLLKVAAASVAFGLISRVFAGCSHRLSAMFKTRIRWAPLRPFIGGVLVIGLFWMAQTPDYLGLGVWSKHPGAQTIPGFFTLMPVDPWSWLWKMVFTLVTLNSGFKGGEVTPLFFIGTALGHVLAGPLGAPPDLFAALGFVAIFAGATKTPVACTLMGVELFGSTHVVLLGLSCLIAHLCSGRGGIYAAQNLALERLRERTAKLGRGS